MIIVGVQSRESKTVAEVEARHVLESFVPFQIRSVPWKGAKAAVYSR